MYQSIQPYNTQSFMYEKQIFTVNSSENYKKALHAYKMKIDNQESAFNIYYLYQNKTKSLKSRENKRC